VSTTHEYFERTATDFAANYATNRSFVERRNVFERLIEDSLFTLGDGSVCVDVGCGDGSLSRAVAVRGHRVIGIDQSNAMLSLAREAACGVRVESVTEYVQASIPLPQVLMSRLSGRVGLLICSSVLEYVDDYPAALVQFGRLLKAHGRLIVSVPNADALYRMGERLFRRLHWRDSYLRYQRHQFRAGAFKAELGRARYSIVADEYFALPFHGVTARCVGGRRSRRLATLYAVVAEAR